MTRKIFIIFAKLIFTVSINLISPPLAQATLKVNEVYSHPVTGQQEWVELYLPHPDPNTDVSGWSLWDTESSPSLLFTFELDTHLSAGDYYVPSMKYKLNNTGDTIVLKDQDLNIIDTFSYSGGESEKSWSLMIDNSIQLTEPTKGSANINLLLTPFPTITPIPTPTPAPSSIHPKLTRFMACPKVGNEWVEIYNPHQATIYLKNYELWDAKNRFYRFVADEILPPSQTIKIELNQSILNNSGDILALYSPNNELVESTSYESCDALIPWEKKENGKWILKTDEDDNNQDNSSNSSTKQNSSQVLGESIIKKSLSQKTSTSFKFPPLPDLKLKTSPPTWDFSENVVFFTTPFTIWGALGVIIGGLLIGGPSLWSFYVEKQTAQLKKFP